MITATVIGAHGFVGSAFVRLLSGKKGVTLRAVSRDTYAQFSGQHSDIVIDASGNSKKFLAERDPAEDFQLSVTHRLKTLRDFPADYHLHVSSADVYSDLTSHETTREETPIDFAQQSHYGFNKLLAEQLVRHHAKRWLILRLAGMVGAGLRKNPVFDILNGHPLFIHPDSQYQFMLTDEVASIAMGLFEAGAAAEIINVCGDGLISPAEIASLAGRPVEVSPEAAAAKPRIVNISVGKIKQRFPVTSSRDCIARFLLASAR